MTFISSGLYQQKKRNEKKLSRLRPICKWNISGWWNRAFQSGRFLISSRRGSTFLLVIWLPQGNLWGQWFVSTKEKNEKKLNRLRPICKWNISVWWNRTSRSGIFLINIRRRSTFLLVIWLPQCKLSGH